MNLVSNIGNDAEATHTSFSNITLKYITQYNHLLNDIKKLRDYLCYVKTDDISNAPFEGLSTSVVHNIDSLINLGLFNCIKKYDNSKIKRNTAT